MKVREEVSTVLRALLAQAGRLSTLSVFLFAANSSILPTPPVKSFQARYRLPAAAEFGKFSRLPPL